MVWMEKTRCRAVMGPYRGNGGKGWPRRSGAVVLLLDESADERDDGREACRSKTHDTTRGTGVRTAEKHPYGADGDGNSPADTDSLLYFVVHSFSPLVEYDINDDITAEGNAHGYKPNLKERVCPFQFRYLILHRLLVVFE